MFVEREIHAVKELVEYGIKAIEKVLGKRRKYCTRLFDNYKCTIIPIEVTLHHTILPGERHYYWCGIRTHNYHLPYSVTTDKPYLIKLFLRLICQNDYYSYINALEKETKTIYLGRYINAFDLLLMIWFDLKRGNCFHNPSLETDCDKLPIYASNTNMARDKLLDECIFDTENFKDALRILNSLLEKAKNTITEDTSTSYCIQKYLENL